MQKVQVHNFHTEGGNCLTGVDVPIGSSSVYFYFYFTPCDNKRGKKPES